MLLLLGLRLLLLRGLVLPRPTAACQGADDGANRRPLASVASNRADRQPTQRAPGRTGRPLAAADGRPRCSWRGRLGQRGRVDAGALGRPDLALSLILLLLLWALILSRVDDQLLRGRARYRSH